MMQNMADALVNETSVPFIDESYLSTFMLSHLRRKVFIFKYFIFKEINKGNIICKKKIKIKCKKYKTNA